MPSAPRTLLDKIWDDHVVCTPPGELPLLYIDRHLVHEVTSPQAFEGLRLAGRRLRRPEATFATPDHNVPTTDRRLPIADPISKQQIDTLRANCREFGVRLFDLDDVDQGIVHVIGPELGITQPGMTIVCGDSHTATHGAMGALAFGIGTSEVEHVLATQTLRQAKPKSLEVRVEGSLPAGVTAKDIVLYLIGRLSTEGGVGHVIEYTGECIRSLGMEQRMTVCNMSIEAGARAGMIAPDAVTFDYLRGRDHAPKDYDAAVAHWEKLPSDPGAVYDRVEIFRAADVVPQVTWGTNPAQVTGIDAAVPDPAAFADPNDRSSAARALDYMGLSGGTRIVDIPLDRVFIGSCTNSRIEDLRAAASVLRGYRVAPSVRAMVVPGSGRVKRQAEQEGLDRKRSLKARVIGDGACLQIDMEVILPPLCSGSAGASKEFIDVRLVETDRHDPVLDAVVEEDVGERRGDHGTEAVIGQRPGRVLTAGATAEVAAGQQDARPSSRRLIELKVGIQRAVWQKTPVEEQKLTEAGPLDPLEELLGDDLVSVDIGPVDRGDDAGMGGERLHGAWNLLLIVPFADVDEVPRDRGGGGHGRRDEVRAAPLALTALKVAVARRRAPLLRGKRVGVHPQTHAAARLAPIEASLAK